MDAQLIFRLAGESDLPAIINMLADDPLGISREDASETTAAKYLQAFKQIQADTNQELTVATLNGEIVATMQLSFIQYLTYEGGKRMQIEAVRTQANQRGLGIGTKMIEYAITRGKEKGCHMVQLTSDKKRHDAIRFYQSLGFVASHEGMKLKL